ncbi:MULTISPECIES: DUF2877 domain-containing protein [unclassified Enterococcus]|uniref:DUF2877 domain-containing protein n=1 Tax=unclassified Enterococcus TaxID=2608891 RepID=UPI001CE1538A|nr:MULTISPECIES: DUF2877 domain-containing protein [unclassified Enterococcus]MCA5012109.1 DUF2877 domain-containing protein [Enterococcus sp. S23]MCA5015360.1 DUF2877 domain-containing protein [Enterococcus sp. S22(2020)]
MQEQTSISTYLATLNVFGKMGKIHSVFDRSFNIAVNDRLININAAKDFLSSFGMKISAFQFEQLQPYCQQGNLVKLTRDSLTVYSKFGIQTIQLTPMNKEELKIQTIPYHEEKLQSLAGLLKEKHLESAIGLPIGNKEIDYFAQLAENKGINPEPIVTYLIGRGKGLTPSGDDILLGYLFMLKTYQHKAAPIVSEQIKKHIKATTSISENYFYALLDGYVSSVVMDVWRELEGNISESGLEEKIDRLLEIGHTSGYDMCYGILLGTKAVIKEQVQ